jgi:DUF4097 and DUF4098 domain-containing protein YvlB
MDENVMRVLQMLQDGKISAQEAETLIAALRGETSGASEKKPAAAPEAPDKPFMGDFRAKFKQQKIDLDLEHLGERISKAVSKVQPEKIVARVQAQLRSATKSSASWGASMSAKVRNWADGVDARPTNIGGLPEHAEKQEHEFHLDASANVLIENPLGNITVVGVDEDTAYVVINKLVWGSADSLKAQADLLVVDIGATDSRLDIKVSAPDHCRDAVVDLELRVPASATTRSSTHYGAVTVSAMSGRVEASTTTGSMQLTDIAGDVRGETTTGGITLERVGGSATVATESGDIKATGISRGLSANSASGDVSASALEGGRIECKSVSGDVRVENVGSSAPLDIVVESLSGDAVLVGAAGNIAIKAVSGDIIADELVANRVQAQTVSGDVKVKIHASFSGTAQINTVSGDVDLGLPADTNARVSLSTASGELRCDHDAQSVVATDTLWTGEIGTGAGTITVQTISGDSHITQVG